ncbi:MAG: ClpXP protease specificity-enhancing factor SspB [Alphaproteobacteria bacterium]|jgi:hypothetical protein|nr:ClpXP protease specificity-enhancing factor SspB [Alphaproteobacteria bacterium]
MTNDLMKYDQMVEEALRGVVRKALQHALDEGLPGDHHFYLTFRTTAPGVSIPEYLQDQYPEEMTIVLQHQFWDLTIEDEQFTITLSFKNRPAELRIPYDAMTAFVDPSVKFGLQFNADFASSINVPTIRPEGELVTISEDVASEPIEKTANEDGQKDSAEVVSLDQFRKK